MVQLFSFTISNHLIFSFAISALSCGSLYIENSNVTGESGVMGMSVYVMCLEGFTPDNVTMDSAVFKVTCSPQSNWIHTQNCTSLSPVFFWNIGSCLLAVFYVLYPYHVRLQQHYSPSKTSQIVFLSNFK